MAVPSSASHDSPNAHLRDFVLRFFADGPHLAALRYRICSHAIKLPLLAVVRGGPLQLRPCLPNEDDLAAIVSAQIKDYHFVQAIAAQSPWQDSKMAAEFVTLLCADLTDLDARVSAAAFNSRKLGGFPSMAQIRMEPSADLPAALSKAIAVQRAGDAGRAAMGVTVASSCTALAVTLADCAALRAEEQHNQSATRPMNYTHRFVLLVDGTGVGLYQAWGSSGSSSSSTHSSARGSSGGGSSCNNSSASGGGGGGSSHNNSSASGGGGSDGASGGYSLQDWLQRSPAVMSYEQATEFARAFHQFCGCISWDEAANGLYLQLFGVDVRALAAARGVAPPGRVKSWTRVLEVPYVTARRTQANARLFMHA